MVVIDIEDAVFVVIGIAATATATATAVTIGIVFVGVPARVGEVPRPPLDGFVRLLP
jgi:hypothetical protein